MVQVNFHALDAIADARIRFVVIAVRCPEGWVFCRHKARATWEFPGGHREKGETVAEAARRELYEETGITGAELRQVAVYSVTNDQGANYGMLCFAETGFFPAPPEKFEIGETTIRDLPPEELTYPEIVPALFEYVQGWLNLQSSADELWDVYDENRNPTGRLHRRVRSGRRRQSHGSIAGGPGRDGADAEPGSGAAGTDRTGQGLLL